MSFTPHLPLFVPCPNALSDTGDNRDKFVPRTLQTSSEHTVIPAFEFLGRLLGMVMFAEDTLHLSLPSVVWKSLVQEPITGE